MNMLQFLITFLHLIYYCLENYVAELKHVYYWELKSLTLRKKQFWIQEQIDVMIHLRERDKWFS